MSANPPLPPEFTRQLASLLTQCDAHAKARADTATASSNARLAAVMGTTIAENLRTWPVEMDVAEFVQSHDSFTRFTAGLCPQGYNAGAMAG